MTGDGWAVCADPRSMLRLLGERAGDRRLRLFSVACGRRAWHLIRTPDLKDLVETLEQVADGRAPDRERIRVRKAALQVANQNMYTTHGSIAWELWGASVKTITRASTDLGESAAAAFGYAAGDDRAFSPAKQKEREEQAHLLRDLFGPVTFRADLAAWRTPDVRALAAGLYETGDWERLPILADALEEAGCAETAVLAHLRGPGPHARGCHVIDLLLGKE